MECKCRVLVRYYFVFIVYYIDNLNGQILSANIVKPRKRT